MMLLKRSEPWKKLIERSRQQIFLAKPHRLNLNKIQSLSATLSVLSRLSVSLKSQRIDCDKQAFMI